MEGRNAAGERSASVGQVSIPYRRGWVGRHLHPVWVGHGPFNVSIPYRRGWVGRGIVAHTGIATCAIGFNPLPAGLGWKDNSNDAHHTTWYSSVSIPYRRGWVGRGVRLGGVALQLLGVSIPYRRGWVGRPGT